jgi:CubicO group peptidase (beta-lactamase class C family)
MTTTKVNKNSKLYSISDFLDSPFFHGTIAIAEGNNIVETISQGKCVSDKTCDFNTQYAIGSITKQFTAAALLRVILDKVCNGKSDILQEQLEKPIIHFLKDQDPIWREGKAPDWAKTVTLHHLLSHTSGLADVTINEYLKFDEIPHSRQEVIDLYRYENMIHDTGLEPGTSYLYSAINYFLAGVIVEKISEKTLSEYLDETFFKPLNMESTFLPDHGTIETLISSDSHSNIANGYYFSLKDQSEYPVEHYFRAENNQGEGGMISSVNDLILWNKAFYTTDLILPQSARQIMLNPTILPDGQITNYGYGIEIKAGADGSKIYSHDGIVPGFHSRLIYDSKHDLTFVHLSNISFDLLQFSDYFTNYQAIDNSNMSQEEKDQKFQELTLEYPEAENQMHNYDYTFNMEIPM